MSALRLTWKILLILPQKFAVSLGFQPRTCSHLGVNVNVSPSLLARFQAQAQLPEARVRLKKYHKAKARDHYCEKVTACLDSLPGIESHFRLHESTNRQTPSLEGSHSIVTLTAAATVAVSKFQ